MFFAKEPNCQKIAKINEQGIGRIPSSSTAQEIHCVFKGEKPIAMVNLSDPGVLNSVSYLIENKRELATQYPNADILIDATVIYNPKVPDSKYYAYIYTNYKLLSKVFNIRIDSIENGILLGYRKEDIKGYELRLRCLNIFGTGLNERSPEELIKAKMQECWKQYAKNNNLSSPEEAKEFFNFKFNEDYTKAQENIKKLVKILKEIGI